MCACQCNIYDRHVRRVSRIRVCCTVFHRLWLKYLCRNMFHRCRVSKNASALAARRGATAGLFDRLQLACSAPAYRVLSPSTCPKSHFWPGASLRKPSRLNQDNGHGPPRADDLVSSVYVYRRNPTVGGRFVLSSATPASTMTRSAAAPTPRDRHGAARGRRIADGKPPVGHELSGGQVQRHHTERAENACRITRLRTGRKPGSCRTSPRSRSPTTGRRRRGCRCPKRLRRLPIRVRRRRPARWTWSPARRTAAGSPGRRAAPGARWRSALDSASSTPSQSVGCSTNAAAYSRPSQAW